MQHNTAHKLLPAVTVATTLLTFSSIALAEGDPQMGRQLAQENCVRCHNVEPDGKHKEYPPSFASIAIYRSADQIYGKITYPPLHSGMPQLGWIMTPDNLDDLVAYIVSLDKP